MDEWTDDGSPCCVGRATLHGCADRTPCGERPIAIAVVKCCAGCPTQPVRLCIGHAIEVSAIYGGPLLADVIAQTARARKGLLN